MLPDKGGAYHSVAPAEDLQLDGAPTAKVPSPGNNLYASKDSIRWYIALVVVYALLCSGFSAWTFTGPRIDYWHVVLRTGNIKVDQLYSGLGLSLTITPVAIMIRRMSTRLGLMHPFAVASKEPVPLSDIARLADPGVAATFTLWKYSSPAAFVQSVLLFTGAFLVPIGTLLVTTGEYSAPLEGIGVIGLPTGSGGLGYLDIDMGIDTYYPSSNASATLEEMTVFSSAFTQYDTFAGEVVDDFQGTLVSSAGVVSGIAGQLGPAATTNITYEEDVTYHGVVTYIWDSGCQVAHEITYVVQDLANTTNKMVNFTWPDGSVSSRETGSAYIPALFLWGPPEPATGDGSIPIGPTMYYATSYVVDDSVSVSQNSADLDFSAGYWISRVKCTPTFSWEVSSCTWKNNSMQSCISTPGANTTELDLSGLNVLEYYMRGIPYYIYNMSNFNYTDAEQIYGEWPIATAVLYDDQTSDQGSIWRAPGLVDYHNMYGLIAQSITTITTAGDYGVAEVPTTGSVPKPVYVVRTYILAIVVVILVLVPLLTGGYLFIGTVINHTPVRVITFLTIANAVRGPWWDDLLWGGAVVEPDDLVKRYKGQKVMFGVDSKYPRHVGLAPEVERVDRGQDYW